MNDIQKKIIEVAQNYLDIREVNGNNSDFSDTVFENNMEAVGWDHGQAWCAYFAELVWRQAFSNFDTMLANRIGQLFSASAVQTLKQFSKADDFRILSKPIPGAVVIWRHYKDGKPTWMGHAGICIGEDDGSHFPTIEGNTNKAGDREGQGVEDKQRSLITAGNNGLHLMGFIIPAAWLS